MSVRQAVPCEDALLCAQVSGLSVWIGRQLEPMSGLPPWAVTLLACLLVSAVTEFASNPATLTVFLPILSALVWKTPTTLAFHLSDNVPLNDSHHLQTLRFKGVMMCTWRETVPWKCHVFKWSRMLLKLCLSCFLSLYSFFPYSFSLRLSLFTPFVHFHSTLFYPVWNFAHQPPPHFDPVHHVCVIWGHASSREPPQRHRLQLRPRANQRYGTTKHTLFLHLQHQKTETVSHEITRIVFISFVSFVLPY